MEDVTQQFGTMYHPQSALLIYKAANREYNRESIYIEAYDIGDSGQPINAHPLSVGETIELAKALDCSEELSRSFLKAKSLLPANVLYINPDQKGFAVWHTPAQKRRLMFTASLGIECGEAFIPALIWKATKTELFVYAVKSNEEILEDTILYHAPFFNVYKEAKVCMGTVDVDIANDCYLEEFIEQWQGYFFESYFSHLVGNNNPIKGNMVALWQSLVNTSKKFPLSQLKDSGLTLKKIIR